MNVIFLDPFPCDPSTYSFPSFFQIYRLYDIGVCFCLLIFRVPCDPVGYYSSSNIREGIQLINIQYFIQFIMNRSRNLTPFSKPKQKIRRKTVSQFNNFITSPEVQLQKQYSTLAKESIDKDYEVSGLQPFSYRNVTQIQTELSDLKISVPQKNTIFSKKESVREKMDTIICKIKTKRYNRERKGTLIKSLLENDEATLISDYTEEINSEKQNHKQIIKSINKKLVKYFPDEIDLKGFNGKNRILRFKKESGVSKNYTVQQPEDLIGECRISRQMQKQHSKTRYKKKKQLDFENLSKKYNSARQIPKSGKYSKAYFNGYLCSYENRKSILSIISK